MVVRFDGNVCIVLPYSPSGQCYYSYSRCLCVLGSAVLQLDSTCYIPVNEGAEGMQ